MATIDQYLSDVKSAIYGEDVRDSIVNAIKAIDTENQTLRSSVDASVQNTLENYQIYELVETLPEVGNQNKIYAKMDLETIDSDSNNSTSEQSLWESLQSVPYIQASVNPDCVDNMNANAAKPVMTRYYLTNAIVSHQAGTQTLKSLTVANKDFTIKTATGRQTTLMVNALVGGTFIPSSNIPNTMTKLTGISLNLTFQEYIYDSDDRKWKFNNTKSVKLGNITATRASLTEFGFDIRPSSVDLRLNAILLFEKKAISGIVHEIYYNGYSERGDSAEIVYLLAHGGMLGFTAYDVYGYETDKHTDRFVISCKSSPSYMFQGAGVTIGAIPGTPYIWDVKVPSQSVAKMYIWSDALRAYLRLSGAVDPTDLYPNGYTRTILSTAWNPISGGTGYTCAISDIVLSSSQAYMISVSPEQTSKAEYVNNNVYCSEFTSEGLIFVADSEPSTNITVGIVVQKINGDSVINNE